MSLKNGYEMVIAKKISFLLVSVLFSSALSSCASQPGISKSNYNCGLSKVIVCDKEHNNCNPVTKVGIAGKVHATFYPESLSVNSYEGDKLLNKTSLSLWQVKEDAIFITGHGDNIKGDETVWAGSIDRNTGKLFVLAISVDYNFIVNGECQLK